ncbi:hypothetical protein GW17_00029550 [Ensete ventricosum]|nr:hypothetical protein GW17_00029550 [Ensete ventricosum]
MLSVSVRYRAVCTNPRAATTLGQRGLRRLVGDPDDVASNSLSRRETFRFPARGEKNPRAAMALGRPLGGVAARAARDGGNRPSTTKIDSRWSFLVIPPGSGRSVYWSAAGPVCTGRYGLIAR